MEKFSLYDLLAVLFPGIIFLYLLDAVRQSFGILSSYPLTDKWQLLIIMAVMAGALIYTLSFLLTTRFTGFYRITGMYCPVSELYHTAGIHQHLGSGLNKRAAEWYGNDIFFSKTEYTQLSDSQKHEVCRLQDDFYDRMYYELDYAGKLTTPKAFQSFYLFFRNVFVASTISIVLLALLALVSPVISPELSVPDGNRVLILALAFLFLFFCSNFIARWYRQRMITKMYWFFYTHINSKL